jgi:hypothetical protein
MDYVLGEKGEEESVISNDRFGAVYSHDNESLMSNGQFKALNSRDYGEEDTQDGSDSDTERKFSNDDSTVQPCASGESAQYQANTCTNILIETFQINPKEIVVKIMVSRNS